MSWAIWRVFSKYDRCRNVILSFIYELKNGKTPCVIIVIQFPLPGEHICNYFELRRPTIDKKKKLQKIYPKSNKFLWTHWNVKVLNFEPRSEYFRLVSYSVELPKRSWMAFILTRVLFAKIQKQFANTFCYCTINRQRCNSIWNRVRVLKTIVVIADDDGRGEGGRRRRCVAVKNIDLSIFRQSHRCRVPLCTCPHRTRCVQKQKQWTVFVCFRFVRCVPFFLLFARCRVIIVQQFYVKKTNCLTKLSERHA